MTSLHSYLKNKAKIPFIPPELICENQFAFHFNGISIYFSCYKGNAFLLECVPMGFYISATLVTPKSGLVLFWVSNYDCCSIHVQNESGKNWTLFHRNHRWIIERVILRMSPTFLCSLYIRMSKAALVRGRRRSAEKF